MKYFIHSVFSHRWAILFAILTGIIIAFPQFYFRYDHKDIYSGIDLMGTDAEIAYWSRVQEVRDGYFSLGNVYSTEGKNLPYLQPPLSEIIVASLGKSLFLDTKDTILLGKFFFPMLIFLLIYALVYQLTKSKIIGLICSTTVLLSSDFFSLHTIADLFVNHKIKNTFLDYARPIAPQTHLLFFYGFLLLFWLFLEKKQWIYGIMSSVVLGLSFYTYPYTWTFLYTFLGCLIFVLIWQKKWFDIKNIILIGFSSLIIAIPYFLNLLKVFEHPLYSEVSSRFGIIKTHIPQIGVTVAVLLIIFLLFFPRKRNKRYSFCLSLVVTPLVVLNQQVITGRLMQPGHYHWYYFRPLLIIFLIIIIFEYLNQKIKQVSNQKFWYRLIIGLIFTVNLCNGFLIQFNSYNFHKSNFIEKQRYGPILHWLNNNIAEKGEIFTNFEISDLISAYTSLNALHSCFAENYLAEVLFLEYRLDGLDDKQASETFFKDRKKISSYIYGMYYREKFGDYGKIPDRRINHLVNQYNRFLSLSLPYIFTKYQIKYIIWDTAKQPNWKLNRYPFLSEIYQKNGIKIYRVK